MSGKAQLTKAMHPLKVIAAPLFPDQDDKD